MHLGILTNKTSMPFRSMQRLEKQTLVLNIKVNMNKITGLPYDKKA